MRLRIILILAIAVVALGKLNASRDDLNALYHQKISDPSTIREYFSAQPIRKLQLGAGSNYVKGWLNSDIEPKSGGIYLDASAQYPFPDGSIHYIFAEHLIEHLPWEGGLKMLQECRRVLAPGGKIRIVTPNLTTFVRLVSGDLTAEDRQAAEATRRLFAWPDTAVVPAYVFNRTMREWGHQFIYDPATLRKTFELAGFSEIKERRIGEPTDPVFAEVELRTRARGEDLWFTNSWGAMAFEATR